MSKIKIAVSEIKGICDNGMEVGDYFVLEDNKISIPEGKSICLYGLNSMILTLPILQEKEVLPKSHWVNDITKMTCPSKKVTFSFTHLDE